jgi:hypothetical protein
MPTLVDDASRVVCPSLSDPGRGGRIADKQRREVMIQYQLSLASYITPNPPRVNNLVPWAGMTKQLVSSTRSPPGTEDTSPEILDTRVRSYQ